MNLNKENSRRAQNKAIARSCQYNHLRHFDHADVLHSGQLHTLDAIT